MCKRFPEQVVRIKNMASLIVAFCLYQCSVNYVEEIPICHITSQNDRGKEGKVKKKQRERKQKGWITNDNFSNEALFHKIFTYSL